MVVLLACPGGHMGLDYGSVVDWDTLGRPLALLALEAVFYFALTLWLDYHNRHGTSLCSALHSYFSRWVFLHLASSLFFRMH